MCFRPPTIDLDDVKCEKCGAKLPAGATTCPECGAVQSVNAAVAPPSVPGMGGIKVPGASGVPGVSGVPKTSVPRPPKPPAAQ